MNDEGGLEDLSAAERELLGRLEELGPLMRDHEEAQTELDAAFAHTLRRHLEQGETVAPHPAFARDLRARLLTGYPDHRGARRRRVVRWLTLAAALSVLVLFSLAVLGRQGPRPTILAPYPTRADLIYSFPAPSATIRRLTPAESLVHPRSGIPFAGHLQLGAGRLPASPSQLQAYRLAPPAHVVGLARKILHIRAPAHQLRSAGTRWTVASEGGYPTRQPLHSIALSTATGELIYHDRRNFALRRAKAPPGEAQAVSAASSWLARLGWPARQMPLRSFTAVPGMPKVRQVVLGWPGVGPAATEEATLWVTPDRSIIEAWVWPPVVQRGTVPAGSISQAWDAVRSDHLPLAVLGVPASIRSSGVGRLSHTTLMSVLSRRSAGQIFLVPVYRFEGIAHIRGASEHVWFSLAPGQSRGTASGSR